MLVSLLHNMFLGGAWSPISNRRKFCFVLFLSVTQGHSLPIEISISYQRKKRRKQLSAANELAGAACHYICICSVSVK
jgi:hypothetical protein